MRVWGGFVHLAGSAAFNRVAGSIDGCHVCVKPPAQDADCYLNQKLGHSIQLQAMVEHTAKFIDVCVGYPGSVQDSQVLKTDPIHRNSTLREGTSLLVMLGTPLLPNDPDDPLLSASQEPYACSLQQPANKGQSRG